MGELFGFDARTGLRRAGGRLATAGVAVWDVLRSCRRVGSLDSAVERDSMVVNDFAAFYAEHPSIERVFFNGGAAEANYRGWQRRTPLAYRDCHQRAPPHHALRGETAAGACAIAHASVAADLKGRPPSLQWQVNGREWPGSPRKRENADSRRERKDTQDTEGRRCAQGRSASISAASDSSVASSNGLPTN